MHKFRIAFVNTHPIQYFAPLYAYLNQTGEFAITALYLSDFSVRGALDRAFGQALRWDIELLSGYNARFVKGACRRNEPAGFFHHHAADLARTEPRQFRCARGVWTHASCGLDCGGPRSNGSVMQTMSDAPLGHFSEL